LNPEQGVGIQFGHGFQWSFQPWLARSSVLYFQVDARPDLTDSQATQLRSSG